MNKKFVQQLRDRIAGQPASKVYMNFWMAKYDDMDCLDPVNIENYLLSPSLYECNTVACCAGHACMIDLEQTRQAIEHLKSLSVEDDEIYYGNVAGELIGIRFVLEDHLFCRSLWPSKYQEMNDKDGLLAILDRAIEEESFEFLAVKD